MYVVLQATKSPLCAVHLEQYIRCIYHNAHGDNMIIQYNIDTYGVSYPGYIVLIISGYTNFQYLADVPMWCSEKPTNVLRTDFKIQLVCSLFMDIQNHQVIQWSRKVSSFCVVL